MPESPKKRNPLNELSLYSGAGGGLLGSKLLGWRAVCYVENDPYCVRVLQARIADGYLDDAPIWDDARTFDGRPWRGCVDIVTAGFPCQPWSVAGRRKGAADDRNLWPDTIRIIREVAPRYCLLENVPGLLAHEYFGQILGDLAASGFDAEWGVLSAVAVGAPHIRRRAWLLAYANSIRHDTQEESLLPGGSTIESCGWWGSECGLERLAHGTPQRVDRHEAIGRAQVPAVVREAWRRLTMRIADA
jgi:DNA (cytosine-5)-methyltransferase 1